MKLHGNHRTCPSSRRLICAAGARAGMDDRGRRRRLLGAASGRRRSGLRRYREAIGRCSDRSSRPRRSPRGLPRARVAAIEQLRRVRMTAAEIAEVLELPLSTVSLWLKRIGLGKRSRLEPLEPPNRYQRRHPGELVHVDIKTARPDLRRGAGHRVHRQRASQHAPPRRRPQARLDRLRVPARDHRRPLSPRLRRAPRRPHRRLRGRFPPPRVAWYADRGVHVQAVMSDNGSCLHQPPLRPHAPPSSASDTSGSNPTDHAPTESRTADPNAAQRMGLRPHLRQLHRTNHRPHRSTSTATTTTDHTAASATNPRPQG